MTMNKLRMWNQHGTWEEATSEWESGVKEAEQLHPIKKLKRIPSMPGITQETAKNLKWKSLKWMLSKDHDGKIISHFLKHPFKYSWSILQSLASKKPIKKDDDFFLYNVRNVQEFQHLMHNEDSLLVLGFSYCHKPFECPSGRFTDACIHDPKHPVCRQCFIGKCVNALPEKKSIPLYIPTVHYISGKILDLMEKHPDKQILFLITACEMTLEMFGDFGKMANIKGIGVRLDGRICNTMKAFELSENGIKPGLTVVLDHTQQRMLELIRYRREIEDQAN